MAKLPKIAIVGRPNVGKSALFNCMVKRRLAIVDELEGVTRDRLYGKGDLFGRPFEVVDTGGMLSDDPFYGEEITKQAQAAINEADAVVLVVDGRVGPLTFDMEVAKIVRRVRKPVALAVNKIDTISQADMLHQFACLGISPMIAVSALHKFQIAELLEAVLQQIAVEEVVETAPLFPKVAIIGRPNVGKSHLLNTILGEQRCIVSPVAGTTRDSIDTTVIIEGQEYTLIDTAGIRRKPKEHEVVEKFAAIRTQNAIDRADVCLLLVDCQTGITSEEKKIAREIEEAGKGCLIALNKWDLVHNFRMEHVMKGLEMEIPFLANSPKVIISAKTGRNVLKLFPIIDRVLASQKQRVSTNALNRGLKEWMEQYHPPAIGGRRLKIYYMTQVDIEPPEFVLFVNAVQLMDGGYRRYLINNIREAFNFEGVPFILRLKGKEKKATRKTGASLQDKERTHDRDLKEVESVLDDMDEGD
jgi:GTPase